MNSTELSFDERVNKVYRRIRRYFSILPREKFAVADPLIQSYAFYKVELEELEKQIADSGVSENYRNGKNQSGMKLSTALAAHLKVQKNMQTTAVKLLNVLPDNIYFSKAAPWSRKRQLLKLEFDKYIEDGERKESETFDEWLKRKEGEFYDPNDYYEDWGEDEPDDVADEDAMKDLMAAAEE